MLEPAELKMLTPLFKLAADYLPSLVKRCGDKLKAQDLLGRYANQYIENFLHDYDQMSIFGMRKPVRLGGIYINVHVLENIKAWSRCDGDELSRLTQEFIARGSFGDIEAENRDGLEVIAEESLLIVLGQPGAGKTTFLKHLGGSAVHGRLKPAAIPVFVSLKDFADQEASLLDFITAELDTCKLPEARLFAEQQLQAGQLLLLLDGLDEVSEARMDWVLAQIETFCRKYNQNRFVLSCRVAAYKQNLPQFTVVQLAEFDQSQIEAFVGKWFSPDEERARLCWEQLSVVENKPIMEIAKTPLLLTLLCLTFDQLLDFPANRSEIYNEALEALLKKWDSSRSIKRDTIYKKLSVRRKKELFSRIASKNFEEGTYIIPQKELEAEIGAYLENLASDGDPQEVDSSEVLNAIEAQHAILVTKTRGYYSFAHLSFQEYYVASYIVDHGGENTVGKLVQHLAESRWREVFLLTAELLPDADALLLKMKAAADALVVGAEFNELLAWAEKKTVATGANNHLPVIRSWYLFFGVRTLGDFMVFKPHHDSALGLADALGSKGSFVSLCASYPAFVLDNGLTWSYAFSGICNIERVLGDAANGARGLGLAGFADKLEILKAELPKDGAPHAAWQSWAERYRQLITKERGIGHQFQLNEQQIESLADYLYANKLIVDCLKSEAYITKGTREKILAELLLPQNL